MSLSPRVGVAALMLALALAPRALACQVVFKGHITMLPGGPPFSQMKVRLGPYATASPNDGGFFSAAIPDSARPFVLQVETGNPKWVLRQPTHATLPKDSSFVTEIYVGHPIEQMTREDLARELADIRDLLKHSGAADSQILAEVKALRDGDLSSIERERDVPVGTAPPTYSDSGIDPPEVWLEVGSEIEMKLRTSERPTAPVSWSSHNLNIAEVQENGLVTGRGQGEATIVATVGGTVWKARVLVANRTSKLCKRCLHQTFHIHPDTGLRSHVLFFVNRGTRDSFVVTRIDVAPKQPFHVYSGPWDRQTKLIGESNGNSVEVKAGIDATVEPGHWLSIHRTNGDSASFVTVILRGYHRDSKGGIGLEAGWFVGIERGFLTQNSKPVHGPFVVIQPHRHRQGLAMLLALDLQQDLSSFSSSRVSKLRIHGRPLDLWGVPYFGGLTLSKLSAGSSGSTSGYGFGATVAPLVPIGWGFGVAPRVAVDWLYYRANPSQGEGNKGWKVDISVGASISLGNRP